MRHSICDQVDAKAVAAKFDRIIDTLAATNGPRGAAYPGIDVPARSQTVGTPDPKEDTTTGTPAITTAA